MIKIWKLAGILIIIFVIFLPTISKLQELKSKQEKLEQQIEYYQVKNRSLEKEVYQLKNDPMYLERVAREKLKVAKEGEVVYKVETNNTETEEDR